MNKPKPLGVLILAAGQGTRMQSAIPKVLHPVGGHTMLSYTLRLANALKPDEICVIIGHEAELVKASAEATVKECSIGRPVSFIRQKKLLGSGSAVVEAVPFLKRFRTAVVMCADTPLLTFESLYAVLKGHREQKAQVTLLTARMANPKGYGRIVRSPLGEVMRIVEESVGTAKELSINEINSGAYCFEVENLLNGLREIKTKGPKGEYFLTDILEHVRVKGGRINAHQSPTPEEVLGVNSRIQLSSAERIMNRRWLERLMMSGVTVLDPNSTYVDIDVEVGQDTVLLPSTILRGKTRIGKNCRVGPFCVLDAVEVGNDCEIAISQLTRCRILTKSSIGPFSHIRPESTIGPNARVGNFSEIKASRLGFGAKVNHLSYIGDAEVFEDVNIGAGTITCNYDGKAKHKTTIEAGAFIGSNVNLVAPVKIGRGAMVAAGSTVTENVPPQALAIARARQENKEKKR